MSLYQRAVVDTNVLSYTLLGSMQGEYYRSMLKGYFHGVTCVTPEELYFGAERRNWGARKMAALQALLDECVLLPVSMEIARTSASLRAQRERAGRPLDRADAWIAATALCTRAPLFTHDRDFEGIEGLQIMTARISQVEDSCRRRQWPEPSPGQTARSVQRQPDDHQYPPPRRAARKAEACTPVTMCAYSNHRKHVMDTKFKSRPPTSANAPWLDAHGRPPMTLGAIIDKWHGVFEDEFWDEVRIARPPTPLPPSKEPK